MKSTDVHPEELTLHHSRLTGVFTWRHNKLCHSLEEKSLNVFFNSCTSLINEPDVPWSQTAASKRGITGKHDTPPVKDDSAALNQTFGGCQQSPTTEMFWLCLLFCEDIKMLYVSDTSDVISVTLKLSAVNKMLKEKWSKEASKKFLISVFDFLKVKRIEIKSKTSETDQMFLLSAALLPFVRSH